MRHTLARLRHRDARPRRRDDGMTTAEYAVGTVAVAGLGGLLLKLLTSDWFWSILQRIFTWAFQAFLG